jgi:hypothetical protein
MWAFWVWLSSVFIVSFYDFLEVRGKGGVRERRHTCEGFLGKLSVLKGAYPEEVGDFFVESDCFVCFEFVEAVFDSFEDFEGFGSGVGDFDFGGLDGEI